MTNLEGLREEMETANQVHQQAAEAWYKKPTKRHREELNLDDKWISYLRAKKAWLKSQGI